MRTKSNAVLMSTVIIFITLAMVLAPSAFALDYNWDSGGATDNWVDTGNWDRSTKPVYGDTVYLNNGGTIDVTTQESASYVYVGSTANSAGGTINVDASGIATPLPAKDALTTGGSFELGYAAGSTGTLNLTGGTATTGLNAAAGGEIIGRSGTGVVNQSGGRNYSHSTLSIGQMAGSQGTYNLLGGVLYNRSANEYVGRAGTGTFNQEGGSHTANASRLYVGGSDLINTGGGTGTYNLSGGTLQVDSGFEHIGSNGIGTFKQTGGTNTLAGTPGSLYVGGDTNNTTGTGTYELSGDVSTVKLIVKGGSEEIGVYGGGTFTQTGGTNTMMEAGSTGSGIIIVGGSAAGGQYHLDGGAVLAPRETIQGNSTPGRGLFDQTGGTNTVSTTLTVGGGTGTRYALYQLSGGTLSAATETISGPGTGSASIVQTGGTNTVSGTLSLLYSANASYKLQGGTLNAGAVTMNAGLIEATGGTANVAGTLAVNNLTRYTLSGTSTLNAGTITLNTGGQMSPTGGTLNFGTWNGTYGGLNMLGGTLSPDGAAGAVRTSNITGYLNTNADTSLVFDLASASSNDKITTTQNMTLATGTNVVLRGSGGYVPDAGSSFVLASVAAGKTISNFPLTVLSNFGGGRTANSMEAVWINDTNGVWGTATNWNPTFTVAPSGLNLVATTNAYAVPTDQKDVYIVNGGTATINSAAVADTVTVSGGSTLNLGSTLTASQVTVGDGGTLKGAGTINGILAVEAGGVVAPGNSFGTLTVSQFAPEAGSTTQMEIGRVAGVPTSDQIFSTGNFDWAGTLKILSYGDPIRAGDQLTLFSWGGTASGLDTLLGSRYLIEGLTDLYVDLAQVGNTIQATVGSSIVPELPAGLLIPVGLILMGALLWTRRLQAAKQKN